MIQSIGKCLIWMAVLGIPLQGWPASACACTHGHDAATSGSCCCEETSATLTPPPEKSVEAKGCCRSNSRPDKDAKPERLGGPLRWQLAQSCDSKASAFAGVCACAPMTPSWAPRAQKPRPNKSAQPQRFEFHGWTFLPVSPVSPFQTFHSGPVGPSCTGPSLVISLCCLLL